MNRIWFRILLVSCICALTYNVNAVVAVQQSATNQSQTKENTKEVVSKHLVNLKEKTQRSFTKLKKRVKRTVKHLFKKNNSFGNVLNSRKFRLGALLFLVGLIGAIVINVVSLAQIFGWLAGVIALAGLVLMIWSLIEHS